MDGTDQRMGDRSELLYFLIIILIGIMIEPGDGNSGASILLIDYDVEMCRCRRSAWCVMHITEYHCYHQAIVTAAKMLLTVNPVSNWEPILQDLTF